MRDLTISQHELTTAMQHLSTVPKAPIHLWKVLWMSRPGKVLRVASGQPHAPPRCAGPSIHLSLTLRPLPGGRLNALAPEATPQGHNLKSTSFTAWTTRVSILFAPHAFAPERQSSSRGRLRHRYSSRSLRISPLLLNSTPLRDSNLQYRCSSQVEPGISHLT